MPPARPRAVPGRRAALVRAVPVVALSTLLGTLLAGALSACGSDAEPGSAADTSSASEPTAGPSEQPSAGASGTAAAEEPDAQVVPVEVSDDAAPGARTVEVSAGEPVVLALDADEAGELHVHSTPEQEISFEAGRSRHELVLDRPGVVDVESHDLGAVLVRLEVR